MVMGGSGPQQELLLSPEDAALGVARLGDLLKTDDPHLLAHFLIQVSHCTWQTEKAAAANLTLAMVAGIAPRDPIETLLAIQMTATHNIGMEFLRRTILPGQSTEGISEGVRRATQLLRLFAIQTETLHRRRGGSRQTVVVQHVQVDAGGQAIVGNVHHGPSRTGGGGG
jgi:hypothetical protein